LVAAIIRLIPSGLIFRFGASGAGAGTTAGPDSARRSAYRFRCASAIRFRCAAVRFFPFLPDVSTVAVEADVAWVGAATAPTPFNAVSAVSIAWRWVSSAEMMLVSPSVILILPVCGLPAIISCELLKSN